MSEERFKAIKLALVASDPWLSMSGNEGLVSAIATGIEAGLAWVPQFRCTRNRSDGRVCRMNENHKGTCRSANGEEW